MNPTLPLFEASIFAAFVLSTPSAAQDESMTLLGRHLHLVETLCEGHQSDGEKIFGTLRVVRVFVGDRSLAGKTLELFRYVERRGMSVAPDNLVRTLPELAERNIFFVSTRIPGELMRGRRAPSGPFSSAQPRGGSERRDSDFAAITEWAEAFGRVEATSPDSRRPLFRGFARSSNSYVGALGVDGLRGGGPEEARRELRALLAEEQASLGAEIAVDEGLVVLEGEAWVASAERKDLVLTWLEQREPEAAALVWRRLDQAQQRGHVPLELAKLVVERHYFDPRFAAVRDPVESMNERLRAIVVLQRDLREASECDWAFEYYLSILLRTSERPIRKHLLWSANLMRTMAPTPAVRASRAALIRAMLDRLDEAERERACLDLDCLGRD